jgi:GTPase SAR1 family protein
VSTWIEEISKKASPNSFNIIIANKIDMINHRVVTKEEGENLAKSFNLSYFETSAKDDNGVSTAFEFMTEKILNNIRSSSDYIANNNTSVLGKVKKDNKKGKCC